MRTAVVVALLLAGALRAEENAVKAADREEFRRLYAAVADAEDARWVRDAKTLRRAYDNDAFVEGVRQTVEVHGVALQRGDRAAAERAAGKPSRATVRVSRTGCAVYLVLCGYDAIDWRVQVAEGVDLQRVIVYGVRAQRVRGVAPSKVIHKDRVFVLNHRDREYARFSSVVARHVPGRTIHTYNGRVDPGGKPIVVGPGSVVWRRQMLLDSMRDLERRANQRRRERELRALSRRLAPVIVWLPGGIRHQCDATVSTLVRDSMTPIPGPVFAMTVDPETGHRFLLDRVQMQEYGAAGNYLGSIALPRSFRSGRYSGGVTFDVRRRRVVAVTALGDFAEFPLATRTWRSLGREPAVRMRPWGRHGSLTSMIWDPRRDCFWSLYVRGRNPTPTLHRNGVDGTPQGDPRAIHLRVPIQGGARNGTFIRMVGPRLVIYAAERVREGRRPPKLLTARSFVVDPETGKVLARHQLRQQPSIPAPLRADLPVLWEELKSSDCYSAMRQLGRGDDKTVAFLRARWEEQPVLGDDEFRNLLRHLGASHGARRWDAMRQLAQLGHAMRANLARALEAVESPHVRMALQLRIEAIDGGADLPRRLDQVLSEIGTERALALRALVRAQFARRD